MTGSSPADLAVTFRSIDRRLREALRGRATAAMKRSRSRWPSCAPSSPRPRPSMDVAWSAADLAAQCAAIAAAIERVPANEWDGARLDRLRSLGLDAGRLLRSIADLAREG